MKHTAPLPCSARPVERWRKVAFWTGALLIVLMAATRGTTAEPKSRPRNGANGTTGNAAQRKTVTPINDEVDDAPKRRPLKRVPDEDFPETDVAPGDAEISQAREEVVADAPPQALPPESTGLLGPQGVATGLPLISGITVLSLAPSILMMTTCFVRFTVVLGLLRQALGTQQLPPNSVLSALCLFLTFLVMQPVWRQSYEQGIRPYTDPEPAMARPSVEEATELTLRPLRGFMSEQIERAGNSDTVWMLLDAQRSSHGADAKAAPPPTTYDEVPFPTLSAAYVLSELKAAFVIGFQILLPFVVIDLVVALLLTTLGMVMLPPTTVSFPFKLLLFVLIDGWALTVGKLLSSVGS
ncbi:MAG: flagellar type III secretion system pore protein FliP [Planctomycetota bacterium]|nr:flagellar type III secretion system pore protein FliP [Planctomycetota bacterium]